MPYVYFVVAGTLGYDSGSYGSVNSSTKVYTAGTSIGAFTIQVTDSNGSGTTASTTITVLPPTPTSLAAAYDGGVLGIGQSDTLTWSYSNTAYISGFTIYTTNGTTDTLLTTVADPTATTYKNTSVSGSGTTYKIVANSGPYTSGGVTAVSQ